MSSPSFARNRADDASRHWETEETVKLNSPERRKINQAARARHTGKTAKWQPPLLTPFDQLVKRTTSAELRSMSFYKLV